MTTTKTITFTSREDLIEDLRARLDAAPIESPKSALIADAIWCLQSDPTLTEVNLNGVVFFRVEA